MMLINIAKRFMLLPGEIILKIFPPKNILENLKNTFCSRCYNIIEEKALADFKAGISIMFWVGTAFIIFNFFTL